MDPIKYKSLMRRALNDLEHLHNPTDDERQCAVLIRMTLATLELDNYLQTQINWAKYMREGVKP